MPKVIRKSNDLSDKPPVYSTLPWICTQFGDHSEIEAYIETTRKWEVIADVHSVGKFDAEDIADFIIRAVNKTI